MPSLTRGVWVCETPNTKLCACLVSLKQRTAMRRSRMARLSAKNLRSPVNLKQVT